MIISELQRMVEMVELLAELPEVEQQNLARAFVAMMDAYYSGQQAAMLAVREDGHDRPAA
jgi:hypothetical protein